jgi:hypothetical protein
VSTDQTTDHAAQSGARETAYDGETGHELFTADLAVFTDQPRSGPADDHVDWAMRSGNVSWAAERSELSASLQRTGGWDETELTAMTDEEIRGKVIWIAVGDWQEEHRCRECGVIGPEVDTSGNAGNLCRRCYEGEA